MTTLDKFLAHARTDVDRLVAMVEAARGALVEQRDVPEAKYFQLASYRRAVEALAEIDRIAGGGYERLEPDLDRELLDKLVAMKADNARLREALEVAAHIFDSLAVKGFHEEPEFIAAQEAALLRAALEGES